MFNQTNLVFFYQPGNLKRITKGSPLSNDEFTRKRIARCIVWCRNWACYSDM